MALNLDPASIAEALRKNVESWSPSIEREEVGRVIESGDGIARVSGLPQAMANELLEFPGDLLGLAFNLDEDEIGCIILGDASSIEEGDPVKQTGKILSIPVGDGFLGRVVDALGRPLDDKGPIPSDRTRVLELQAPNVVSRQPVKEPLYTGIAAIAGAAIGAHWMYGGDDALIIYDDLSKQAVAYREISLLLRRPPGREAYPGDVFYLHSRLLERAAKLSDALGGGSLTALPIIETKGGDVSAYIPTNVISITDGQIYLEPELFFSGVRPAINVGISVSRVGGNAQVKAMKDVAGRLRLDLAQFRALEAFAQFGSELDRASQQQLARGARVVEVLKQPQYQPQTVERQVVAIWTVTSGHLDRYPVEDAKRFVETFQEAIEARHPEINAAIRETGKLDEATLENLSRAVEEFAATFAPSGEAPGSESGIGRTTEADPVKPDIGWDRMSSAEDATEPEAGDAEAGSNEAGSNEAG